MVDHITIHNKTIHNVPIHKRIRSYEIDLEEVMMKGSGDEGKW